MTPIEERVENSSLATKGNVGVNSVTLDNFRNYDSLHIELDSGFNIFAGRNAQGKTNFLEALYLLATTRLLRGHRDHEAIREGSTLATVTSEMRGSGTKVGMILERGARKRATLNGVSLPRAADIMGRMPCVSVTSEDMAIVRGDPSDRRMFLDLELSSLFPSYLRHFTLYKRALEQRNALLRNARDQHIPEAVFDPWEDQLAEHGCQMRMFRDRYVLSMVSRTQEVHAQMGSGETILLGYVNNDGSQTPDQFRLELDRLRTSDIARGGTSVGPHRDDLTVEIEGKEARLFGSQGQQRTAVIAVKMASFAVIRDEIGNPPLLLLDDILSDLDEKRRALLVDVVVENASQTVLTCTEANAAGTRVLEQARIFEVKAGRVELK